MNKYEPLRRFLEGCGADEVVLTFAGLEQILGAPLPASKAYAAWWSNNPHNNVMTRAWLAAGYRSERVDVAGEKVGFRRGLPKSAGAAPGPSGSPPARAGVLGRLRAALGGTVNFSPEPSGAAAAGEARDDRA